MEVPVRKPLFFVLAAALVAGGWSGYAAPFTRPMTDAGRGPGGAHGFTLPSQDGSQISLDSFKGKWVVLYFYPKDMTQGCTIEAHNFQRDLAQFEAKNAVIRGRERGYAGQPQAVLHQRRADLPAAGRSRAQGGGSVRLAGHYGE
jgi:hypothetical protein